MHCSSVAGNVQNERRSIGQGPITLPLGWQVCQFGGPVGRQLSAGAVGGDMMVLCIGIKSHKEFPLFDRSTTSSNDPNAIATLTRPEQVPSEWSVAVSLVWRSIRCCGNVAVIWVQGRGDLNECTVDLHYYAHSWDWAKLNGEVTVLQGANLPGGIQFGTEQMWP